MLQARNAARSGCQILQQQRRAANQHLASLRRDGWRIADHGDKFERDQAVDRGCGSGAAGFNAGVRNAFKVSHWDGVRS